ncbi:MAG: HupE/UreJ family protein [Cyanobacteria bacterium P01_F01_bin.150]
MSHLFVTHRLRGKRWQYLRLSLIAIFLSLVLTSFGAIASHAHWADLATIEIDVQSLHVDATITLPTQWVSFADQNQDQRLSPAEIQNSRNALETFLSDRLPFTNRQQPADSIELIIPESLLNDNAETSRPALPNSTSSAAPSNTHSSLNLRYQWEQPTDDVVITYNLFDDNRSTAQALGTIVQSRGNGDRNQPSTHHVVFTAESPTFALATVQSQGRQFFDFLRLGMGHILTGYDHILFLISLLVVGGGLRELWKVVTAFTLAHSVTLSLAALNLVSLPSVWIERAIALSLIYVAAENIFRQSITHRWQLTFVCGLIHGLGFAGILQDLNLSTVNLPLVITGFNLGIEIGQLVIISVTFIVLQWLRNQSWSMKIRYLVSWSTGAMGCLFLIQRFSIS